jgi:hypothetical protein
MPSSPSRQADARSVGPPVGEAVDQANALAHSGGGDGAQDFLAIGKREPPDIVLAAPEESKAK